MTHDQSSWGGGRVDCLPFLIEILAVPSGRKVSNSEGLQTDYGILLLFGMQAAEGMDVNHEVKLLVEEITRLGSPRSEDGKIVVKFGVLFSDDRCANLFEALVGTLRAAKRKKIIAYEGELLLQGTHDNVDIVLLKNEV